MVGTVDLPSAFPGGSARDIALFSDYLAAINKDGELNIYHLPNLKSGPVKTLMGAQRLGRTESYLAYASHDGVHIVCEVDGKLTDKKYSICKNYTLASTMHPTRNVTCSEEFLIVWGGEVAEVFEVTHKDDGSKFFTSLGDGKMPMCECHGGWYGAIRGDLFLTADAFAGVTVMQIKREK